MAFHWTASGGFFLIVDRKPYLVPVQIPAKCELRDEISTFRVA